MSDAAKTIRPPVAAIATLPNLISLARLCSIPVAVWLVMRGAFATALLLFVLASASDAVDGWLARRSMPTRFGAILDPLADKLLLAAMYGALAVQHLAPIWLAVLVVSRDILIVGGVAVLTAQGRQVVIAPLIVSKLNTLVQAAFVALALMLAAAGRNWPGLQQAALVAVTLTTAVSGAWYLYTALTRRRDARR